MREIKFRAWEYLNKEKTRGQMIDFFPYAGDGVKRDDIVLMQFTGLKDKNGKEIYEGDVVWDLGRSLEVKIPNFFVENFDDGDFRKNGTGEVIGNIYENPELLT